MSSSDSIKSSSRVYERLFSVLIGIWLGLALLKFGNPVILDRMIPPPEGLLQLLIQPWPVAWGRWMLVILLLAGLGVWNWKTHSPVWLLAWPMAWWLWQLIAGTQTVDPRLTQVSLMHFASCVVCFYLGHFSLSRTPGIFMGLFIVGFLVVLASGFQQHFGGLEETRRYFYLYELPKLPQGAPPELLQKLASNRIYGTLMYPNTLAGVIILLLPVSLAFLGQMPRLTVAARAFLAGLVGLSSLACLFWSGSKAGWLIVLCLAVITFLRFPIQRKIKWGIASLLLMAGLIGFFVKYADYFEKGATSVGARFDYWRAALVVMKERPVFGSGPGTFAVMYQRLKAPESEMARLAHNDYLQQGSDAGLPGLLLYSVLMGGMLSFGYRTGLVRENWLNYSVWLGLFGLAVQGLFEFGLFIPALSWPQFLLMGWLLQRPGILSSKSNRQPDAMTLS